MKNKQTDNTILNRIVSDYFSDPMAASTPMPNPTYAEETLQDAENTAVWDLAVKGTEHNPWLNSTTNSEQFHSLLGDLEGNSEETIGKLNSSELEMFTPESDESAKLKKPAPKVSPKITQPSPNQIQARKSERQKKKPVRYGQNTLCSILD